MTGTNLIQCHYCNLDDSFDKGSPIWVGCEYCNEWIHLKCLPLQYFRPKIEDQRQLNNIKEKHIKNFICKLHSNSTPILELKGFSVPVFRSERRTNLRDKRAIDYIALNEGNDKRIKHEHPHKKDFLACFEKWRTDISKFSEELEEDFYSIKCPLRITDPDKSGMDVVSANELGLVDSKEIVPLNVDFLTKIMGPDYILDVMDVQTQMNEKWTLSRWNDYFTFTRPSDRDRIRNVISMEVSHVEQFKSGISRPKAVDMNDLVDLVWNIGEGDDLERPKVTKYILMSVANAYTDFHLDFAGTSVYYNVISGSKMFLLFPPTQHNLRKYEEWCANDNQNFIFLGDLLKEGIAVELTAGDLFMIPCGYIHAVFTPEDSFIVGGNFLTLRDLTTQLKVVEIEQLTKVPRRFTFPQFESVMGKTCEWILASNQFSRISHEDIQNLISYLSNPKIKYKPKTYPNKKDLINVLRSTLSAIDRGSDVNDVTT